MVVSTRDTASSLSCLLDPPTGDDAGTKVCRPAGGGHQWRTVLRWYQGRVRNPSYQRNLFHAQPPVGRGWAVRWRSTGMMVRRSSCRARSSCRIGRVVDHYSPYASSVQLFLSALSAARETDPGAATEILTPWSSWPGSNRARRTRRERCLWTIGQRFVGRLRGCRSRCLPGC